MKIRWPRRACALGLLLSLFALVAPSGDALAQDDSLEPFRIVVIPDTQIYSMSDLGASYVQDMFDWVAATAESTNTVFVTHVGDVVQNPSSVAEWNRIEAVWQTLDATGLPHGIAPGNHDLPWGGALTNYDARFPSTRYAQFPWFGGSHPAEGNRSSWQEVTVDGHQLLFLHLRHLWDVFGPVQPVLDWADAVLAAHPDHLVFVTTHEFTHPSGSVSMPDLQNLIADHCNVAAVFSGHEAGDAAVGSFDDGCGRTITHMLTNYQFYPSGGDGLLRTIDIDPLTLDAQAQVYSPTFDRRQTGSAEQFSFSVSPLVPVPGDANCDRSMDVLDALVVAQFDAGLRAPVAQCPLVAPETSIDASGVDLNNDGTVDVLDALLVARCSVGIVSVFCPLA